MVLVVVSRTSGVMRHDPGQLGEGPVHHNVQHITHHASRLQVDIILRFFVQKGCAQNDILVIHLLTESELKRENA